MIPKIIHQIWIGPDIAPFKWMHTWQDKNPSMEYKLWREVDIIQLETKFKDKIDYLISRKIFSCACDIIRLEILNKFGGIYIDVDSTCLKSIENASFMNNDFFVGKDYDHKQGKYKNRLANGTIGAIPGHPIIKDCLNEISKTNLNDWEMWGGTILTKCVEKNKNDNVAILPICTFYPKNFDNRKAPIEGEIYATHHWGSTKGKYIKKN